MTMADFNVGNLIATVRLDTTELDKAPAKVQQSMQQAGRVGTQAANRAGQSIAAGLTGGVAQGTQQAGKVGTQTGQTYAAAVQRSAAAAGTQVSRDLQQNLRPAGQAAARAGGDAGGKFSKGFKDAAAGAAVGFGLGAILSKAMDAQGANAKLRVQLNLSASEVTKFGDVARKVFGDNFAGNLGEANDAIKSVILNIGGMRTASAATMTSVTEQVSGLASTFGVDLADATKSVGQLMKTGLAPDAQTALDTITAGFQAGVDKSGDFLDTLNEYSTQFRKLGIDGKTATGLLSQGLQGGARDSDIVGDALKELSIRVSTVSSLTTSGFQNIGLNASDMYAAFGRGGKDAAAATEQVLNGLRNIREPTKQAAAATALFGTQSEDLGKALYSLDLPKAAKQMGDVAGRAGDVAASSGTAAGTIAGFMHSLENTATAAGTKLLPKLETMLPALGGIANAASDVVGTFTSLPKPLEDAGLALGGLLLLRGPLIGMFGQIQARAATAAVSLAASNGIAGAAGVAAGGLSRVAGVLGGPWGLAIGAGIAGLISWISNSKGAGAATRDFSTAIDAQTGKLTANAAVDVATQVKDSIAAYKAAGGAAGDYTAAVEGNIGAQKTVIAALTAAEQKQITASQAYKDNAALFDKVGISAADLAAAYMQGGQAVDVLRRKVYDSTTAMAAAGTNTQAVNKAFNAMGDAVTGTGQQVGQFHSDVGQMSDSLKTAATIAADAAASTHSFADAAVSSAGKAGDAYVAFGNSIPVAALNALHEDTSGVIAWGASVSSAALSAKDSMAGADAAIAHLPGTLMGVAKAADLSAAAKSVADFGAKAQTASAETDAFALAVDKLTGRDVPLEDATKSLNAQILGVSQAFKDATAATKATPNR
jgi:hypothetical protein